MARFFLPLLLVLGLVLPAAAAEPKRLLVFGDSLSAGYGLRAEEAWPALLQQRLGEGWKVVNASQSGETTAGGLTRLPAALKAHKPDVLLIELGANDGLRGLPVEAARGNLAAMIEQGRRAGAQVALVAVRLPPNFGGPYTRRFDALFAELAKQYKLPQPPFLLDGIADKPELFQADQLHPVAGAQARLVDNVWPALAPLLGKR
ncbi:arylesterase [Chitinimonas koreensis]|uniref:arylesterase n=1 Tax=Chitinimonas koreensis TaxID=356302 RepID=UPI000422C1BB|nr:arylesterase [Chitinimonas koreensis]QNM96067.1 arylesterase [Chitinimonas koreensis]